LNDPSAGGVTIKLYNILGQEIFSVSDIKTTRLYNKKIFLNDLSKGIYILQTQVGKFISAKKVLIH
jgi:hypothetical protein